MRRREAVLGAASAFVLVGASPPRPVDVAIVTTMGTIVVQLDPARAPITVRNFLRYVDGGLYDGAAFYRAARVGDPRHPAAIGIIQGGIEPRREMLPPIPLEPTTRTGLHNVRGAISMARSSDPNSATSEFFICTADDRALDADRFPDHEGYAAFGHVIRGFDIALRIDRAPIVGELLSPPIKILRMRRL